MNMKLLEEIKLCKHFLYFSVLLDTRQDNTLKIKGAAREIINRIQKLKKKTGLKTDDEVFIFYHFDTAAETLNEAIKSERKMIENAVKKPMFPLEQKKGLIALKSDEGAINGEKFKITITHPHFMMNNEALKVFDFLIVG